MKEKRGWSAEGFQEPARLLALVPPPTVVRKASLPALHPASRTCAPDLRNPLLSPQTPTPTTHTHTCAPTPSLLPPGPAAACCRSAASAAFPGSWAATRPARRRRRPRPAGGPPQLPRWRWRRRRRAAGWAAASAAAAPSPRSASKEQQGVPETTGVWVRQARWIGVHVALQVEAVCKRMQDKHHTHVEFTGDTSPGLVV